MVCAAGRRLRVLVTSSDLPRYDGNPNTGQPGVTATAFAPARQAVATDVGPSHIVLPVSGWA
jgi:predicted acyl esterase